MSRRSCSPRVPHGNVDPIRCADDALAVFALAAPPAHRHETIVMLLDRARVGSVLVSVSGTDHADSFVRVVEWAVHAACAQHTRALVVMTVRPDGSVTDHDIDQWLEASAIADRHGFQLVEWFVDGIDGITCPRDLLGEPERW